jgi:hypothetical protein
MANGNKPVTQQAAALSQRNKLIFIILGGQVKGLGSTLQALDPDRSGNDDLAGNIAKAAGDVLVAVGSDNVRGIRDGLKLNIQLSQQWLDDNPV